MTVGYNYHLYPRAGRLGITSDGTVSDASLRCQARRMALLGGTPSSGVTPLCGVRRAPDGTSRGFTVQWSDAALRSSGRKTKNGRFMCYIIMKRPIDIIKLIKLLPLDFMSQTAEDLKADYKVKKLQALRLFSILLIAFIRQSEISQRKVCELL